MKSQKTPATMMSIILLAASGTLTAAVAATIETLDMQHLQGEIKNLDGKTLRIKTPNEAVEKIPIENLSEIMLREFENPKSRNGKIVLETICGDILPVENLTLKKDIFALKNPLLGKISLRMDKVSVILTPTRKETPDNVLSSCTTRKYKQGSRDLLVIVRKDGVLQSARGVLKTIGREKIVFQLKEKKRTISRSSVRAIFLSETLQKRVAPRGVLVGTDGTRIHFTSLQINDRTVYADSWIFGKLKFPRRLLGNVRFFSDRVVKLSELQPTTVIEHGFFDQKTYPYRINSSTTGKPITLDGKIYSTGLGLHSESRLTYALDKKYRVFVAIVGIDDNARGNGNANITILADGKKLLPPTKLTSKNKPVSVRLNVKNVQTLQIIVDSGEDKLPVGDHVDLANAYLIK